MAYLSAQLAWFWDTFQWFGIGFVGLITWLLVGVGLNLYRGGEPAIGGKKLDPLLLCAAFAALVLVGCLASYGIRSSRAHIIAGSPPPAINTESLAGTTKQADPQIVGLQNENRELLANVTSARAAFAKAQQEADQLRAEKTGGARPYALPIMWPLPPLAKELSPYEVGQKLPAIDAFLKFLSEDMQSTIDEGRLLKKSWPDAVRDPGKYPDFRNRLMLYFQKMKSDIDKLEVNRANYPQYQDIVATMAPTYWNIVLPRTEKFIVACQFASANPNKGAIDFFMEDFAREFSHAAQIFEEWRNRTRSRLLEIRKQISQ